MTEKDLVLIEQYQNGTLSEAERAAFVERIERDADFRRVVEEHTEFMTTWNAFQRRNELKSQLDAIHTQMQLEKDALAIPIGKSVRASVIRKVWPLVAVAASVALISIVGTVYMTESLETKQTAYYKELRRNVEQIKKSQSRIIADMQNKVKTDVKPIAYAGTGFLISANGFLATSHHVVRGADSVFIENPMYGVLKATVIYSDPENDLSILQINQPDVKLFKGLPYTISDDEAELGEDVFTLGFPREDIVFGEGSLSATSGYKQNPNAYQISVPVNPGNSGGPLFNEQGDLVGIISGIQTETSGAAFAIKSTVLLDVIAKSSADTLSVPLVLPRKNSLKGSPRVQQVKRWKDHVFMVRVYNHQ